MSEIKRVNMIVSQLETELKEMAHYIHENPELGLNEKKACRIQIELLEKYGFSVEKNFSGFETAYKASYKGRKDGPKICMLSEYDALPELGHGCGHNLISLVSVGAGIAMRDFADEYGGEIYVIGTPAEETVGTKLKMSDDGVFDDMDVCMMAHPAFVDVEAIDTMAVKSYRFTFTGKPAHSAGAPENGVNALDAIINFFNLMNALRQQTRPDARLHGIITKGGSAPNVIPDHTEAIVYVRGNRIDYVDELSEKVINCAKGAALGTGTVFKYEYVDSNCKDTHSNRTLRELNNIQMESLGLKIARVGNMVAPGSSDLGNVSYVCPSIQCGFDITDGKGYIQHTVEFAECAGKDKAMDRALIYVKGFVLTAIELMKNPENLQKIREEHKHIEAENLEKLISGLGR